MSMPITSILLGDDDKTEEEAETKARIEALMKVEAKIREEEKEERQEALERAELEREALKPDPLELPAPLPEITLTVEPTGEVGEASAGVREEAAPASQETEILFAEYNLPAEVEDEEDREKVGSQVTE